MEDPIGREDAVSDLTPSLVAQLRAGEGEASLLLERLYRLPMTRFCRSYLGRGDDAEDVVQDVFCRVLEADTVPENFRAWLYRIARNRCLDLLRRRRRRPDDEPLPTEPPPEEDLTGCLTHLVHVERRNRLQQLVAALPAHQREILRLRYGEGLSRAEIAEILELPESIVKSRLFEGLERLRGHDSLRSET